MALELFALKPLEHSESMIRGRDLMSKQTSRSNAVRCTQGDRLAGRLTGLDLRWLHAQGCSEVAKCYSDLMYHTQLVFIRLVFIRPLGLTI